MTNECGWCGGTYDHDRCPDCGRVRNALPYPYLFLAPGASGDYKTLQEAQQVLAGHTEHGRVGALYIRVDVAVAFGMRATLGQEEV